MMGKLVLKRLYHEGDFALEKGRSYTCGRGLKNTIVCPGAVVSRSHCIFIHDGTNIINVMDLGSSNGVYVNNNKIESKILHALEINDTVGIGCADSSSQKHSDFIYKLLPNPESDTEQENQENNIAKRKLKLKHEVPCKISKLNLSEDDDVILIDDDSQPAINLSDKKDKISGISQNTGKISLNNSKHKFTNVEVSNMINKCLDPIVVMKESDRVKEFGKEEPMDCRDYLEQKRKLKTSLGSSPSNQKPLNHKSSINFGDLSAIKPEQPISMIKEDEKMIIRGNIFNRSHKNGIDNLSPVKLKEQEQDSQSTYSQVDIIDLSDDDEGTDFFPCSQQFENSSNDKLKHEDLDPELEEQLSMASEKDLFQDENVVVLSDDDDDDEDADNPWLARLFRSQLLNESQIKAEEVSQEFPKSEIYEEQPVESEKDFASKMFDDIHEPIEDVLSKSRKKHSKNLEENNKEINKMLVDEENDEMEDLREVLKKKVGKRKSGESKNKKSDKIHSPTISNDIRKSFDATDSKTSNENSNALNKSKRSSERESIEMNLSTLKGGRKIPQIDAPFLAKGERRSVSYAITKSGAPDNEKDLSFQGNKISNNSIQLKSSNMTSKQRKELAQKEKIEQFQLQKDQKLRRMIHKWADVLPITKRRPSLLSTEEKNEIKLDRKEKLKKIADEKKQTLNDHLPAKRVSKAVAKVSMKTRGDFLIPDPSEIETGKSCKTSKISKQKKINESSVTTGDKLPKIGTDKPEISKISSTKSSTSLDEVPPLRKKEKISKSEISMKYRDPRIRLIDCVKEKELSTNKETIKIGKSMKKVTFNDVVQTIVFEIDPGHTLKKCVQKDAALPKRFTKSDESKITQNPKLEEFLHRIFGWNPRWLTEQKQMPNPPPLVLDKKIVPLLSSYVSFDDYYNVMIPLLAIETWAGITRDFEFLDINSKRPMMTSFIVNNSLTQTPIPNSNLKVTTFMLETLVSKNDKQQQAYPVFGDLVVFELALNNGDKFSLQGIFAYVTDVHQTAIAPYTRYNKDLNNYVRNPHTLLTYTMMTKLLDKDVQYSTIRPHRMKTVTYLRSSIRTVQGLQYLPSSPLLKQILQPRQEDFQLPVIENFENYHLITKDKLNLKQLEAVVRITETIVNRIPKICMIQGPPGTGKSKVIVNIITEILYGNNRYKNGKSPVRILVCAPSNAAIDEIVLRLRSFRDGVQRKEQRFKMVRTGRTDMMHELVKHVSLTELAKSHVATTTAAYRSQNVTSDSIEAEKRSLQARINKLKMELESPRNSEGLFRQQTVRKLEELQAKYNLLTNHASPANEDPRNLLRLQKISEQTLLAGADIIACTLSSCYTNQMESLFGGNKDRISVCIVDEATQSTEAETLIPLMLGVTTLVLVGDPNQLPATVLCSQAKKFGLDQSLFARIHGIFDDKKTSPIIMLDTQYRMSYPISYWPNRYFYNGALKNSANLRPLPFKHYRVLNLESVQNDDKYANTDESTFVTNIIHTMTTCGKLEKIEGSIKVGIVTPYNNQRRLIISMLEKKLYDVPKNLRDKLKWEVNTVDSFQGQERDVIIMSCVRSNGIGFLSDRQRLCVAITRAKHSLFICGNFRTFERDQMWKELLADARKRKTYFNVNSKADSSAIKKHIMK